jgi:hypothetical protein
MVEVVQSPLSSGDADDAAGQASPAPTAPGVGTFDINSKIARVVREHDLKRVATDRESATFRRDRTTVRVWVGARWEVARGKRATTGKGAPALAAALAR